MHQNSGAQEGPPSLVNTHVTSLLSSQEQDEGDEDDEDEGDFDTNVSIGGFLFLISALISF